MSEFIKYNGKLYRAVDIAGNGGEVSPKVAKEVESFAAKQNKKVGDLIREAVSAVRGGSTGLQASLAARKCVAEAKSVAHASYTKIENSLGKKGIFAGGVTDLVKIYSRLVHFVNVSSYFATEALTDISTARHPGEVREMKAKALKCLENCLVGF